MMFEPIFFYDTESWPSNRESFNSTFDQLGRRSNLLHCLSLPDMICSGKFIKVEPCQIISDNVLAIFIAVTITDCWVKCKHTNNCETIASKAADNAEITHSRKQITCYLLKTNESAEVNSTAAPLQMNRRGSLFVSRFLANS